MIQRSHSAGRARIGREPAALEPWDAPRRPPDLRPRPVAGGCDVGAELSMESDEDLSRQGDDDAHQPAVFINWIDRDAVEWTALWHHEPDHRGIDGTLEQVTARAARRDALQYWMLNGREFVPWDGSDDQLES